MVARTGFLFVALAHSRDQTSFKLYSSACLFLSSSGKGLHYHHPNPHRPAVFKNLIRKTRTVVTVRKEQVLQVWSYKSMVCGWNEMVDGATVIFLV